jgi:hypothetical protein
VDAALLSCRIGGATYLCGDECRFRLGETLRTSTSPTQLPCLSLWARRNTHVARRGSLNSDPPPRGFAGHRVGPRQFLSPFQSPNDHRTSPGETQRLVRHAKRLLGLARCGKRGAHQAPCACPGVVAACRRQGLAGCQSGRCWRRRLYRSPSCICSALAIAPAAS